MDTLIQDCRYAVRQLIKSPVFTLVAIATLAVGIGANTAVFSVLYRAVIRALPVRNAGRLVHVVTDRGPDGVNYNLSYPALDALRTGTDAFSGVAAHTSLDLALAAADGARRVAAAAVSRGFFTVIGARLVLGRDFLPDEDTPGGPASVVLSTTLWQRAFGGRNDVVGDRVVLNGQPFTVVGVVAAPFTGLVPGRPQELWIPLGALTHVGDLGRFLTSPSASWLDVFARLAPGITEERAQAQVALLDALAAPQDTVPATSRTVLLAGDHGLSFVVSGVKQPLLWLLLAAGLVLLLTCTNVANLLLARGSARRREIAIRLAAGATRGRLGRQLLTESVLLAGLGGLAGLLMARWGVDFLLAYQTVGGPLDIGRGLDPLVIGGAVGLTLVTGVVFGLVPAWRATHADVVPALKGTEPRAHERVLGWRGALVVMQVAISLVLAVGAALFLRSMRNLRSVDIGFTPGPVLLAALDLEQGGYDRERGAVLLSQLLDRLAAAPGVELATAAQVITPNPGGSNWSGVTLEGFQPAPNEVVSFDVNKVGPRYFDAMGIALVGGGRGFTSGDRAGAPPVAVVNEAFARRYYPAGNAIGRHIRLGPAPSDVSMEIIGIAHDGKYRDVRETGQPNVYFPLLQQYASQVTLIVRSSGDPLALSGTVRREVRALDAGLPVFDVRTLATHVANATARDRMITTLSTLFGAIALVLAALGLFGVLATTVTQRTREIGLRIALGARSNQVLALLLKQAGSIVTAGLAIGLAAALLLGRFAADLLYGVAPADPVALVLAAAVLAAAAALASYIPARRATRVDPMVSLRTE